MSQNAKSISRRKRKGKEEDQVNIKSMKLIINNLFSLP